MLKEAPSAPLAKVYLLRGLRLKGIWRKQKPTPSTQTPAKEFLLKTYEAWDTERLRQRKTTSSLDYAFGGRFLRPSAFGTSAFGGRRKGKENGGSLLLYILTAIYSIFEPYSYFIDLASERAMIISKTYTHKMLLCMNKKDIHGMACMVLKVSLTICSKEIMGNRSLERKVLGSVLTILVVLSAVNVSSAGQIATYWGQLGNDDAGSEGSLADLCSSNNYGIVMIAFLSVFGRGQTPVLNLAGHCDPPSGTCARYASDIATCQSLGIKVLLSIGGEGEGYGFDSADEARQLAQYIWDNYLGGSNANRPFGAAQLDGVDLDIESGGSSYYPDLGGSLKEIAQNNNYKQLYMSAAPQCIYPDASLGPATGTFLDASLADFVFVQFYNNPRCDFLAGVSGMVSSWIQWTGNIPGTPQIFLGVPASTDAANNGYIESSTLIESGGVLEQIKMIGNYGGVMLWAPTTDRTYASNIKASV
ncbi:hypothetical protein AXG93_269s1010 [Marchantia polymorpha subsp. ruderalis]|uniref:chitinase n=2 Tax=Marchantia polymorpha TaxID=3197 RepID=A0A176W2Z9_MARPO|nr:hypothetical protein AXG93_269s1010 [Marchantia polymorpha subsp. ruderalis]